MVLLLLIVIPLICAGLIVFNPREQAKYIAAGGSLVSVVFGVVALAAFNWSQGGMDQLTFTTPWVPALGLNFDIGADAVSLLLIALTILLGPICVIGSFTAVVENQKTFYAWLLILQSAMVGVFCARDLVLFYICFEFTLIPMYILIAMFGSSNRRKASTKFFLYTFTGSVIALAGFAYVAWQHSVFTGEWSFNMAALGETARALNASQQAWVLLALMAGFAVKVPLFPVHTWLPLAHTEAPTAGSVILAGVLLKLGTYGVYKFALPFAPAAVLDYAPFMAVLAIIGIVYAGLICWVQTDIKKLVAYSSVSHLGFCMLGLFAVNSVGVTGSVLYMISHGFSTGALFLMIGMMYERYHTRSMKEVSGLGSKMPVWSTFMVFFVMASVGLPGLNGFVSEIMCLFGTFQSGPWTGQAGVTPGATFGMLGPVFAAFAGTGMIVAAIYLLYMTGKIVWGPTREPDDHHAHEVLPTDLSAREIGVLLPLAAGCLVFGLYPAPLMKAVEAPVNDTVAYVQSLNTGDTGRVMVWTAAHEDDHGSDHNADHGDTHTDEHAQDEHSEDHSGEGH
ncbi:MAG: NADH-quinone oxidoreductase subunit M [Phycisphaerales bacterium]|nr:NADH-quinone oxidoreductase subunit M [Phycisphaerales bacterium]